MVIHPFSSKTLNALKSLSTLSEEDKESVFEEAYDFNKEILISGALPFEKELTFSLELAFLFNPLNVEKQFPSHIALPQGWKINALSEMHCELNTSSPQKLYHENTEEEWTFLKKGLEAVQQGLPAGFAKAHMHIGCPTLIKNQRLNVSASRFGRLIKVYEVFWRVLAGYSYSAFSYRPGVYSTYGLNFIDTHDLHIDTLGLKDDHPIHQGVYYHQAMINLSQKYPTMEVKILSGLLGSRSSIKHLDINYLQEDLWWVFALFQCLKDTTRSFPLATLGLPTVSGEKPSLHYVCHFLDTIYDQDVLGKMIALRRFLKVESHPAGASPSQLSTRRLEAHFTFDRLGLGLVYELHEEQNGWDAEIENRLLSSPKLLHKLCDDLKKSEVKNPLSEYFSHPILIKKIEDAIF